MTVKVVVPVSGGKDSQACLQLAVQEHGADAVRGLFCDTQFEHPITYEHVEFLHWYYGVRIDIVTAGSVLEQVEKHERFPSWAARFCTEELKIWPTKRYLKALAEEQGSRIASKKRRIEGSTAGGFEVWYGMRSEEGAAREKRYAGMVCDELYAPHEVLAKYPKYLAKLGVTFRLAVLEWSTLDVLEFLEGAENPLYRVMKEDGTPKFDRVGCFPCLAAGDEPKENAFGHDDFGRDQLVRVSITSAKIGKTVWTSKGGQARNGAGCMVCAI